MSEPVQHFFRSQRLRLCYWAWGDEQAPPLVLIHGGRDHGRSWDPLAEVFEDRYRVIAPDLRGHGDSEWAVGSEYAVRQNVLDLVSLIDLLGGRAHVVGHSFGGQIALMSAAIYPEHFAAVASIEGTMRGLRPRPARTTPQGLRQWADNRRGLERRSPRVYESVEAARDRMQEANPRLTPELALHLAEHGIREVEGGFSWKLDDYARPGVRTGELDAEEAHEFWGAIECPVLLIVGEESGGRGGEQENARYFRDGRAVVVPGAGHWVQHDRLEVVAAEIGRLLAAAPAASEEQPL